MTCCAQAFDLYFNSSAVGDELQGMTITPRLVEDIRERHNFWAAAAIVDAGYPAFIWEYTCPVYVEKASRLAFASWYVDLTTLAGSGAGNLASLLVKIDTDTVIDCGTCGFAGITALKEPESLLWYAAGVVELKFLGTVKPTVTS